jgi:hypothetical protein
MGIIGLSFLSFVCAAYSLYLFSFSRHGMGVMKYVNWGVSPREYVLGFIHIVPLFLMVTKGDMFMF